MSETQLRHLLSELADEAKSYDVAEAAVTGARRRRGLRFAAPAAAALAVIAALTSVTVLRGAPPAPVAGTAQEILVDPAGNPPLIRYPSVPILVSYGNIVLTVAGELKRLPGEAVEHSPSGRYLVSQPSAHKLGVRDVTTGAEKSYDLGALNVETAQRGLWSPDENIVAMPADAPIKAVTPTSVRPQMLAAAAVLDRRSGRSWLAVGQTSGVAIGVDNAGALIVFTPDPALIARHDAGKAPSERFVRPGEQFSSERRGILSPDRATVVLPLEKNLGIRSWLLLDLHSREPLQRIDLAADLPTTMALAPCGWSADGILAAPAQLSYSNYRWEPVGPYMLTLVDPRTGQARSLVRFTRPGILLGNC